MLATTRTSTPPQTVDTYLGFEIRHLGEDAYVAFPQGWSHARVSVLEADSLPAIRKRVWAWWHRLLD